TSCSPPTTSGAPTASWTESRSTSWSATTSTARSPRRASSGTATTGSTTRTTTMIPITAAMGEPLPHVLSDAALEPLWRGLHERFCAGRPVTNVRLDGLDDHGRAAVADLLGSARYPGRAVALARLDGALADIAGVDARTVVERLVGPIENRAAQRAAAAREREELWTWLRGHPVVRAQPVLLEWADTLQRTGMGALAQARPLLESALAVLDRLPAGGAPLPAFAEAVLQIRTPSTTARGWRRSCCARSRSCSAPSHPRPRSSAARCGSGWGSRRTSSPRRSSSQAFALRARTRSQSSFEPAPPRGRQLR